MEKYWIKMENQLTGEEVEELRDRKRDKEGSKG